MLAALWNDLASADAEQAYRAIWDLAGAAGQDVSLLKARLQPAAVAGARHENATLPPGPRTVMPPAVLVRPLRAVEVLEQIGTPAAFRLLQALAWGADTNRLTEEARAARARLDGRRDAAP